MQTPTQLDKDRSMGQLKVTFEALSTAMSGLIANGLNSIAIEQEKCLSSAVIVPVAMRMLPGNELMLQSKPMECLCALIQAGFTELDVWQKIIDVHFVNGAEVEVASPINGLSIHSCGFTGYAIAIKSNAITVRDLESSLWDLEPREIASIVVYANTMSADADNAIALDKPTVEVYFAVVGSTSEIVSATSFDEAITHYLEELGANAAIPESVMVQKYIRGRLSAKSSIFESNLESLDGNFGCDETAGDYSISEKAKELYALFAAQVALEYPVTQLCASGAPVPVNVAQYTTKLF